MSHAGLVGRTRGEKLTTSAEPQSPLNSADHPEFVAELVDSFSACYPLIELNIIRHEPDNRFLECAPAADAELIATMNTAPGHFDRKLYQSVKVVRPSEFLNLPEVGRPLKKRIRT